MNHARITRRQACRLLAAGSAAACLPLDTASGASCAHLPKFQLHYALASSMYGKLPLEEIAGEVHKIGAERIDLWPEHHANQREQMDAMGHERFAELLAKHGVKLGMTTRYDLGPFGLADEIRMLKKFGGSLVVTGSAGPKDVVGAEAKTAVAQFVEKMKPHVELAEQCGVTIGIENHGKALVASLDSIRYLAEAATSPFLGIALARIICPRTALSPMSRTSGPSWSISPPGNMGRAAWRSCPSRRAGADAGPRLARLPPDRCRTESGLAMLGGRRSSCTPCRTASRSWKPSRP